MGLDIYFHKVKKVRKNKNENVTIEEAVAINDRRAKDRVRAAAKRAIKALESLSGEEYAKEYANIFPTLVSKYTPYEWKYNYMVEEVKPIEEVKAWWDKFCKTYYAESDAYFRKVNFIYRYFENKLEDEACIVTKSDLETLIAKCNKVLDNPSSAQTELPTTSGFFFGSTDYDKWYLDDVKDAMKKFKKLLKDYNEDTDIIYVVMSW